MPVLTDNVDKALETGLYAAGISGAHTQTGTPGGLQEKFKKTWGVVP